MASFPMSICLPKTAPMISGAIWKICSSWECLMVDDTSEAVKCSFRISSCFPHHGCLLLRKNSMHRQRPPKQQRLWYFTMILCFIISLIFVPSYSSTLKPFMKAQGTEGHNWAFPFHDWRCVHLPPVSETQPARHPRWKRPHRERLIRFPWSTMCKASFALNTALETCALLSSLSWEQAKTNKQTKNHFLIRSVMPSRSLNSRRQV